MRSTFSFFVAILILSCCGVARSEQTEDPTFTAWKDCKIGTSVSFAVTTPHKLNKDANARPADGTPATTQVSEFDPDHSDKVDMKLSLQSVSDDKIVLKISAKFLGEWIDMDLRTLPRWTENESEADDQSTEATITVSAGTFKTKVTELEQVLSGKRMKAKRWTNSEVPGGLVKEETVELENPKLHHSLELTSIEKK